MSACLLAGAVAAPLVAAEPVVKEQPAPAAVTSIGGEDAGGSGAGDLVGTGGTFATSATLPFYDGFESGSLGGFWMASGSAQGRVLVTGSNAPFSGNFHATLDTSANGTNNRTELTLSLDLTGYTNCVLKFWAKEFGDEPNGPPSIPFTNNANFDGVAISTNGVLWYEVQDLRNLGANYSQLTVNLDAAVATYGLAYGPNFIIRFNQYDNFPIPTDGIAIDDVTVTGLVPGTPGLFINDASVIEGDGTFPLLTFTVRLSQVASNVVTVDYRTVDGTASSLGDYIPVNGTLTFQPGETNQIIVVPIVGDDQNEPDEFFRVVLTNASGATLANNSAVGTILNDDTPVMTVTSATVVEGDAGVTNAVFLVQLSEPAAGTVFLSYSSSGNTATAGSDFVATNGFITIPPGVTNAQFSIPVFGDVGIEPDETFIVFLGASDTVQLPVTSVLGTILDDDNVAGKAARFAFDPIATPQRVGTAFPVKITALDAFGNLAAGFAGPVSLAGVAGFPEVSVGNGGNTFEWPLSTFYHDARLQSIYLASELAGPRQIRSLGLTVTTLPGQGMTNWTIRMKHTTLATYPNTPSWDSTGWTTVYQTNLVVTAAGALIFPLTTPFNYNGTDNLLIDFSFNNTSYTTDGYVRATSTGANRSLYYRTDSGNGDPLTWAARSPAPNVGQVVPDVFINGGQPLSVPVTPVTSGVFSNGMWSGQVAVLQAAERVALLAADGVGRTNASAEFAVLDGTALFVRDVSRAEGDATDTIDFTVSLAFPAGQTLSVDYATVSGSAYAGEDFIAASGTVTFNPGETTKTVPITILGDRTPEVDESFRVVLSNAVNGVIFRGSAVVTLRNDDTYDPLSDQPRAGFLTANGNVNAILERDGVVYLGGAFTEVGGPDIGKAAPFARADGALLPGFPSFDRTVEVMIDDDAGGWFVGGQFSYVDGQPRGRLVRVRADLTVDPNFTANFNNTINALVLDGTNLYVGGAFTSVTNASGTAFTRSRVAVLNATTGVPRSYGAEPGLDNTVNALALRAGVLYIGGLFSQATLGTDQYFRSRMAGFDVATGAIDGTELEVDNTVNTLVVDGDRLYLGGLFTAVNAIPRFRVAAFNLATQTLEAWQPQLSGQAFAILPTNGVVYVGGGFTAVTNAGVRTVRSNLVVLDPVSGVVGSLAPNPTSNVRVLDLDGNELILGGDFQTIGAGVDRRRMASLDVTTGALSAFDPDVSSGVFAFTRRSNFVYAGGQFTFVKGTFRNRLAALDAAQGTLLPWNPNANSTVWSLRAAGSNLYAAGQFTTIGGLGRQRLAALDPLTGTVNAGFQANLNNTARALAVWNNTLFVGGDFTNVTAAVGGTQTRRGLAAVALADGSLSPTFTTDAVVPAGVTSNLLALMIHRDILYLSGAFNSVGGQPRGRLAAIDAVTGIVTPWRPVVPTNVFALAAYDTNIYVGGEFTTITNSSGTALTRNRLAAVSALSGEVTAWNPNAGNTVATLAVAGTNLYVGGNFTAVGGLSRQRIAELDLFRNTTNASPWAPALNALVQTVAVGDNGRIHAGGSFTAVGTRSLRAYAVFDRATRPVLTLAAGTLTFVEDGPPLVLDPALGLVSSADQPVIGATVRIASGFVTGEDLLTVAAPSGVTESFDAATGVLSLSGAATAADYQSALRSVAYRDTSGSPTEGLRTIEFTASNAAGTSATASRAIQVISVNDAPSFTKGPDVTVPEDSGASNTPAWATNISPGPGEATQSVEFLVSNDNPALFAAPPSISPAGGLKFAPAPNAFGSAMVTVTLRDNGGTANGGSDTSPAQTFVLTVMPVNDPPTAQPRMITLTEDTATAIALMGEDIDGDPLSFLIATLPAHGALSGTPPAVTYTPVANYFGPDAFSFRATDGQAQSPPATVSLTVLSVNDAPVADASATITRVLATNNLNAPVLLDGSRSYDVEGDSLTYLWFLADTTNLLGSGVTTMSVLGAGTNRVELIVSDGTDLATNRVSIVVLTPAGAVREIIAVIEAAGVSRNARPLIATLEAALASFNRNNLTSGLNQLQAFQNKVRAQVQPGDPALAAVLNSLAQEIIDALTPPPKGG